MVKLVHLTAVKLELLVLKYANGMEIIALLVVDIAHLLIIVIQEIHCLIELVITAGKEIIAVEHVDIVVKHHILIGNIV